MKGRFFRPVVVASEKVAEAWSTDDFSIALEPIRDALASTATTPAAG